MSLQIYEKPALIRWQLFHSPLSKGKLFVNSVLIICSTIRQTEQVIYFVIFNDHLAVQTKSKPILIRHQARNQGVAFGTFPPRNFQNIA